MTDYVGENQSVDLTILASLEKQSEHPLAEAILRAAEKEIITLSSVSDFRILEGK